LSVRALSSRSVNVTLFVALAVGGAVWIMLTAQQAKLASRESGAGQMAAGHLTPASLPRPISGSPSVGLSPEDAILANAAIPFASRPIVPAPSFVMTLSDPTQSQQALNCLTQAVYYEAATEPLAGQEAVAQVVLNRLRNPIFPKTVCGVVFQGSTQKTGCQFTFTCDGSLARAPNPKLWDRAQKVAAQALAGFVQPAVGDAVNYHADYVSPPWSRTLVKVTQIGLHIFYDRGDTGLLDNSALPEANGSGAPQVGIEAVLDTAPAAIASDPTVPPIRLAAAPSPHAAALAAAPAIAATVPPSHPPRLPMRTSLGLAGS
jgi:hypothetical protein